MVRYHLNPGLEIEGVVQPYDSRTNQSQKVVEDVRLNIGERVFETTIPRNVRLSEAPSYGLPIPLYDSKSKGAEAYRNLALEIMKGEGA